MRSCAAPVGAEALSKWLRAQGESLSVAYEAGPTGFGLARACEAAHIPCLVAARSKITRAPGERVKTDRRDACGWPSCCAGASSRRCACPASPRRAPATWCAPRGRPLDLMRARHRLSKLLLRQGLVWEGSA